MQYKHGITQCMLSRFLSLNTVTKMLCLKFELLIFHLVCAYKLTLRKKLEETLPHTPGMWKLKRKRGMRQIFVKGEAGSGKKIPLKAFLQACKHPSSPTPINSKMNHIANQLIF